MFYLGIDPGKSGGIAVLSPTGVIDCMVKMPQTEADLYYLLRSFDGDGRAMVEHVHASPQMGVVSAFTFGKGYGALLMALTAAKIKFDEVSPRKWQGALQCLTKGDKNVSKRRAQQLFPGLTITHATADALLIAEFCRRFHNARPIERTDKHGSQEEGREEGGREESSAEETGSKGRWVGKEARAQRQRRRA
jgi:crossover junction endodeoxyribonuclease RuvC